MDMDDLAFNDDFNEDISIFLFDFN